MRMVPDYETLECRFQFGVAPTASDEAEARVVPCLSACPSASVVRQAQARGQAVAEAEGGRQAQARGQAEAEGGDCFRL